MKGLSGSQFIMGVAAFTLASVITIVTTITLVGDDAGPESHESSETNEVSVDSELYFSDDEIAGALSELKKAGVSEFTVFPDKGNGAPSGAFFIKVIASDNLETSYRGIYHQMLPFTGRVNGDQLKVVLSEGASLKTPNTEESVQIISWLSHKAANVALRVRAARGKVLLLGDR